MWQDIRYALRSLSRGRGFAVVAIACLALGIGATTTIFSLVNAYYLKPAPFAQPDRLAKVTEYWRQFGAEQWAVAPLNFLDWTSDTSIFEDAAMYQHAGWVLGDGDAPEVVGGERVTPNLFTLLGVRPALGRTFASVEGTAGRDHVVILSDGLWRRRFAADPHVVGRTVLLDGTPYTVVGVMPRSFAFPGNAALWAPLTIRLATETRGNNSVAAVVRLRPGVTIEQADAHVRAVSRRLEAEYAEANTGLIAHVRPFRDRLTDPAPIRTVLLIMLGAVGFVLLIACVNVANLSLARAITRQRELAIRAALGARRRRLVRQLLTESVLVALAGGALGVLIAMWSLDLIWRVPSVSRGVPPWQTFDIDWRVLLFTLVVSLGTGIVFGTLPAMRATRPDLHDALKDGARGAGAGARTNQLRSALVVVEVALSLVLLVGAGLLIRSAVRLESVDPGFDTAHLLVARVALGGTRYDAASARPAFFGDLMRRLEALPGIEAATATSLVPLQATVGRTISVEGQVSRPGGEPVDYYSVVTAHYFGALGIPVLSGRSFTEQEVEAGGNVAIINRAMARHYWNGADAVGRRIRFGTDSTRPWLTVVGVVPDVRQRGLDRPPGDQLYVPHAMDTGWGMSLLIRTSGDPAAAMEMVRREIARADPAIAVSSIAPMREVMRRSFAESHLLTSMFGAFAAVALFLAAVGIYGVIAYAVTQRAHEIGVRMALGAERRDVLRLVVKQGLAFAVAGVAVGVVGASAVTRTLTSLLYGVSPLDPATFAVTSLLLAGVALLASYVPARRAARVDPVTALRSE